MLKKSLMLMVKFGVHMFLWTERFDESTLYLIRKARNMGFDDIEVSLNALESINIGETKRQLEANGMEIVGSVGLSSDTDVASSSEETRRRGVKYLKPEVPHHVICSLIL